MIFYCGLVISIPSIWDLDCLRFFLSFGSTGFFWRSIFSNYSIFNLKDLTVPICTINSTTNSPPVFILKWPSNNWGMIEFFVRTSIILIFRFRVFLFSLTIYHIGLLYYIGLLYSRLFHRDPTIILSRNVHIPSWNLALPSRRIILRRHRNQISDLNICYQFIFASQSYWAVFTLYKIY